MGSLGFHENPRIFAVGIGHDKAEILVPGLPARHRYISDAGRENPGYSGQFFVNHVGNQVACAAQLVPPGGLTIAEHLLATENIEQLELNRKSIGRSLDELTNYYDFHTENAPVIKVDVPPDCWALQHISGFQRRKSSAALKIPADQPGYIKWWRATTFPTKWNDGNWHGLIDALTDFDTQFGSRIDEQHGHQQQNPIRIFSGNHDSFQLTPHN